MEQLIGAEAKDLDDFRIEAIDRAFGKLDDQVIQGRPPALDAAGDLGGERAIAVVVQAGAGEGDRRRQIGVAGGDRHENLVGGDPRRARSWVQAGRRTIAGGQAMAGQELADGHRPLALGLDLEMRGGRRRWPRSGGRRGFEDGARRGVGSAGPASHGRPQQNEPLAVEKA